MLDRSADVARALLDRIATLEGENAALRAQVAGLEDETAVLAARLKRARVERPRSLAPPLAKPRVRSA